MAHTNGTKYSNRGLAKTAKTHKMPLSPHNMSKGSDNMSHHPNGEHRATNSPMKSG